jgi:hypothetical protein
MKNKWNKGCRRRARLLLEQKKKAPRPSMVQRKDKNKESSKAARVSQQPKKKPAK